MAPATDEVAEPLFDESDAKDAAEARVGQVVASTYQITRYVGSGGSSHVYEAEHLRLGKRFAIKLLRPEIGRGKKTAQRFRREARAVARLKSEYIVSVIDCGELADQTPYLVMDLLDGEDLRSLLTREGPLPARRAIHIVVEACLGLTTVHDAGLVHRDLKPENLFVTRRGTGQDWCKVLDFGVAKMEASLSTAQGAIVGTVRYMAPEQLADSAAVGPPTDVYALAAILYECLTGHALHTGETVQEVMYSVMNREPRALADSCPGLPKAVEDAVSRGVSKDPSVRPATTAELARLLLAAVSTDRVSSSTLTLSEEDQTAATSALPWTRSARARWLGLGGAACCAALAVGWLAGARVRSEPAVAARSEPLLEKPGPTLVRNVPLEPEVVMVPSNPVSGLTSAAAVRSAPIADTRRAAKAAAAVKPSASATPQRDAPVGRFDEANPYGE